MKRLAILTAVAFMLGVGVGAFTYDRYLTMRLLRAMGW